MEKTREELIKEFYSKPLYLSYSALNKLLYSPMLYYSHYILRQQEDRDDAHFIEGKIIHCLLLEDHNFDDKFIVMPGKIPTGNTKLIVDKIYKLYKDEINNVGGKTARAVSGQLRNYSSVILDILKEIDLHQKLNEDSARISKILTTDAETYWDFLKARKDKDVVDNTTLTSCKQTVDYVKTNVEICDLLGVGQKSDDKIEIYNEEYFEMETSRPFGLKGFVDNIKIDHEMKMIFINDVKRTGKTLSDFAETAEYYNYWCQAAIYKRLVASRFEELADYEIVFRFIVMDKYNQAYPFKVSTDTMTEWQKRLHTVLDEAEWHYTNKNYTLPYKFALGHVIL